MHFDDRLATVMRLPASGDAFARIQYRQLVDLLGRLSCDAQSEMLDAGLARIEELTAHIPAADRARLLRHPLQPITNSRLLAILAADEPDVATAAITGARLHQDEWLKLIPELPVRARGILRHRRDLEPKVEALLERLGIRDRGLPPVTNPAPATVELSVPSLEDILDLADESALEVQATPQPAAPEPAAPSPREQPALTPSSQPVATDHAAEWARAAAAVQAERPRNSEAGIGAIVRRIEEFRRARQSHSTFEVANDDPRLPLGDLAATAPRLPVTVDFETDQEGRITWADSAYAPSLVGLSLSAHEVAEQQAKPNQDMATTIRHRLPLRAAHVRIAGAPSVSGEWQVDAIASFDEQTGRFLGYLGRLRRPARPRPRDERSSGNLSEADRMRQILHELRTPANAIQVAAEIIQQQLYGPAPHEYRALAAAIAGDCAHILAGFEELDRLVKLESGAMQVENGECDIGDILIQTVARLRTWTDPRRSGFALPVDIDLNTYFIQVDRIEAERLVWRLLAALAGSTAPDEILELACSREADDCIGLRIALPASLAARDDRDMFETLPGERGQTLSAGMFGLGFTLRLAAAEAAAVGGALRREGDDLHLTLPGLTAAAASHSTAVNHSR
ncbi:hypothetical protein [Novosphingobium pentaromativorans]|uniref:histidine kinase n=1 Tax=Novosphingobium pentaromativorans US6-1 TaxID=1088721 RepID=G6E7D8_9SPHN|nr:hypothetical protein [Novosphingobium pentaromativorans]AIT81655.1 histidine kinase [Novosphingobium pentaromativorans US6-1]EHJ62761.1 two-component signal transduction histidine kinase [Novosphingobium pentaromativorans US6-1]